jgi:radical SAM protein with 4Fe4S-binding SPASM domain
LTLSNFRKWIKHFQTASRVKLQGMGEPFLNKELIVIINELSQKDIYIEIYSNGTVFTEPIKKVLTQTPNLSIRISFDGADKEAFERIRIGSDFDKIKEHLRTIANTTPLKTKVGVYMVAFEKHKDQIKPTIELVKELGVKDFDLQFVVVNYGQEALNPDTVAHRVQQKQFIEDIKSFARHNDINIDVADELYDEHHQCPWPWLGTYVDTEGYVIPCCRIANKDICNFGNLNDTGFKTIWQSYDYQRLRQQIKTNNIPEFCKSCYKSEMKSCAIN